MKSIRKVALAILLMATAGALSACEGLPGQLPGASIRPVVAAPIQDFMLSSLSGWSLHLGNMG